MAVMFLKRLMRLLLIYNERLYSPASASDLFLHFIEIL